MPAVFSSGAHSLYGMGRARGRLLSGGATEGPTGYFFMTRTITDTSGDPIRINTIPVPDDATFFKCVMHQREAMGEASSGKDDISLIALRVKMRDPVGGQCDPGNGSVSSELADGRADWKHMVAFEGGVGGQCAEVELEGQLFNGGLSSDDYVTTTTFCYYAGENDR